MYLIVVRSSKLDKDGQFQPERWKCWRFWYINISRDDVFVGFLHFFSYWDVILMLLSFYHFRRCYQLLALTQTLRGWSNTALKGFLDNAPSFSWKRKIKWSESLCFQIWFISQSTFQRWYTSVTIEEATQHNIF